MNPDTPWQREMEAAFPYEDTPDQLQAAEEVKRDMEEPMPMDRLVCGDVGYGKTEVAMRAAFKAVLEGKQVAILVPTTVLAQQHFRTFRQKDTLSDLRGFYPQWSDFLDRTEWILMDPHAAGVSPLRFAEDALPFARWTVQQMEKA